MLPGEVVPVVDSPGHLAERHRKSAAFGQGQGKSDVERHPDLVECLFLVRNGVPAQFPA
jgi:hypothetical protein